MGRLEPVAQHGQRLIRKPVVADAESLEFELARHVGLVHPGSQCHHGFEVDEVFRQVKLLKIVV